MSATEGRAVCQQARSTPNSLLTRSYHFCYCSLYLFLHARRHHIRFIITLSSTAITAATLLYVTPTTTEVVLELFKPTVARIKRLSFCFFHLVAVFCGYGLYTGNVYP